MAFAGVVSEHQQPISKLVKAALHLQGEMLQPREYKLIDNGNGNYMLHLYEYPLGIDLRQLRTINRLQYVVQCWIDPSMRGVSSDAYGALCVHIDLATKIRKREDPIDEDSDDEEDTRLDLARTRRRTESSKNGENEQEPGWLSRLWNAK